MNERKKCFFHFIRFIASSRAIELWLCKCTAIHSQLESAQKIMAFECLYPVVIFFGAKLVIFIARLIIFQYYPTRRRFASFMSRSLTWCDVIWRQSGRSVSVYILLSWENKLSVAAARFGGIHWPAAIYFPSIFFRLRRGFIFGIECALTTKKTKCFD